MYIDEVSDRERAAWRSVPRLAPTIYCPHARIEVCLASAAEQSTLLQATKP
jgi:hypothetical protein